MVGSDYASPPVNKLVGVAEIEFTIEEGPEDNCSDVVTCQFEGGGACGWSLGEHATFTDTLANGIPNFLIHKSESYSLASYIAFEQ